MIIHIYIYIYIYMFMRFRGLPRAPCSGPFGRRDPKGGFSRGGFAI